MSESLEFIAIIAVFAVILFWYLQNIHAETQGTRGLLALSDDPETTQASPRRSAYRIKSRTARLGHDPRIVNNASQMPSPVDHAPGNTTHMRRKFRRQDEVRYRVKDKK
ncbi:MAG: hypothetical protein GXP04_06875 [Alphaproteobacteria bacterium]|nr:hypothetical protein [Alphaproteobacteria bacterium]